MKRMSFDQFAKVWRLLIGTAMVAYALIAPVPAHSLPYVLVAGVGLMGLSVTWPWEKKNGKEDDSK